MVPNAQSKIVFDSGGTRTGRYRSIMFTVGNTLSDTDTGTVHCGCGEEL